jgi:glycosyltransferase involved in cell wall biosynthesis
VVVLYRVPATHQVRELVDDLHRRRTPVVFDVDDLIFDPALEPEIPALEILTGDERSLWLQGVHRYRTTMEMCDAFVGSTQRLCDHAFEVTGLPSFRFPNGAGVVMSRLADRALRKGAAPGALRVGYLSGTDTHDHDWAMIEQAVVSAVAKVPDAELWLVGKLTPGDPARSLGERLRIVPFQPWTSLPALLAALDVNLAPLAPNSRFNDAKSAIKWLEAALSATPTIASPTQAFEEVVEHGVNGMLAACAEEWADAVATLLGDDALRHRLGARARRDALLRFGPWTQARRYLEILGSVERRTSYESTWRPVLLDEPYEPVALEPYGGCEPDDSSPPAPAPASASASAAEPLAAKLGALARRGAASVRRRGLLQSALVALGRLGGRIRRP